MTGQELVKIVETELSKRGISKARFYRDSGISSATFSQWRTGVYEPSAEMIKRVEHCLNINLANYDQKDETKELLQWILEDFSHRALFESAKGLTKEQTYTVASFIEKLKSGDT